jgi:lysophospholipase L1-like esterase
LTFGEKSTAGNTYPQQVAAILGNGNEYRNKGISAQRVSEILTRGPTVADLYWPYFTGTNVYVLWAGTNDMSDALDSAATTYANFKARCQAALAAGSDKVIAVNCLPRTSGNGSFETYRQSFNTLMVGLPGEVANVSLVDVAAISGIGAAGDNLSTTYYDSDDVHLNDAGYGLVAAAVSTAIAAVL